jgi:hypothetical protein
MATFKIIINNILNLNTNIFSTKYKHDNIDISSKVLFLNINKDLTPKNKFLFLKESFENFLINNNDDKKNIFMEYFFKIQKTYNTLNRFVYNYKYKKAQIVVNTDMGLNELNINDKNVFCLFHNNSKYLFLINDLIKIIDSALTNSYMFFSEPKCIKNPYDNLPINKSNLYNIYFFIKYKTNLHPELFFYFFKTNFNLNVFKIRYEVLLRDYIIGNFVKKSSADVLLYEIKKMIKFFNNECKHENKIVIDKDFPKHKLIKIMRPYLELYCVSQYGYLNHIRQVTLLILKKKLIEFNKFNPQFGRKKYKILMKPTSDLKQKICGKILEFNDRHIKFNENYNNNYLTDHLNYNENFLMTSNNISHRNFIILVDEDQNYDVHEETNSDDEENYIYNIDDIHNPTENTIIRNDAEDELDDGNFNENEDNEQDNEEDNEEEEEEENYEYNEVQDYDNDNEIDSIS